LLIDFFQNGNKFDGDEDDDDDDDDDKSTQPPTQWVPGLFLGG
jgi:hypothetical protein